MIVRRIFVENAGTNTTKDSRGSIKAHEESENE